MNGAAALRSDLRELGLGCDVLAEDRLAVLLLYDSQVDVSDAALRRQIAAAALRHGFTHVALEITP